MVAIVCKHNQNGYCKFGIHCRNRHIKEICRISDCQEPACELRHPQTCKYFRIYGNCKFGDACAFLHEASEEKIKIDALEAKVLASEVKLEKLKNVLQELEDRFKNHCESETIEDEAPKNLEETLYRNTEDKDCDLCDFEGISRNSLVIHMGRKHKSIPQLDGTSELEEDERFISTDRYWKTGVLGSCFQTYLDANEIIDESTLDEDAKIIEKECVLQARKKAFGDDFKYYPPWRKF